VPAGLDLDSVVPELKQELRREADYAREARSQEQYRALVGADPGVIVPRVHADLSTRRVLASDRVRALPIEDLRSPAHAQRVRDTAGANLLRLVFRELFEFRFVQTDPNFGNYLFEPKSERIALLDFGSVRSFSRHFTDRYRDLIAATISGECAEVEERGRELGLLRGDESPEARAAFAHLSLRVAEPLAKPGVYDFGAAHRAREVRELGVDAYTKRGLRAPPTELIFLHRKLAGTYLLLAHVGARVDCRALFEEFAK
jgi:predicted unusual protein kinase regulating ubiquinone biosynthesis (AarF/ABC1/UbiB family)